MLILTQYPGGDPVIITCNGVEIRVVISGIVGNKVRVGYEAPRNVVIDREKIHRRKLEEHAT